MDKVDFLGYSLSSDGIQPQDEHVEVIKTFPEPKTKREVKRFLGMAGFYRQFISNFSELARPLTQLTGEFVPFNWSPECQESFERLKYHLQTKPTLAFPRWNCPFIIECDASLNAVGGVLSQSDDQGVNHVIAYFSKALSPSQRKWSTTEKECFALIQATRKWDVYLRANPFTVYTDHNPLVWLRKQKDPRGKFARWTIELEQFEYIISYKPGAENNNADCLSRNPKHHAESSDTISDKDPFEDFILSVSHADLKTTLAEEQQKDTVLGPCWRAVREGKAVTYGRYKRVSRQLSLDDDVLTKAGRPIVPASMRKTLVEQLHSVGHGGVNKTYALVQERFYWYGMYNYVKGFVQRCRTCTQVKPAVQTPKAPLVPIEPDDDLPMRAVAMDIATLPKTDEGYRYFLLIGDMFSKYLEAIPMKDQTADSVVKAFWKGWVTRHGCPTSLLSDQGKNVDGTLIHALCEKFGIKKKRSSSYHPAGNGFAERSIRSIKQVLKALIAERNLPQKAWADLLPEVLMALRSTTNESTKFSPFRVIHGRDPLLPHDVLWDSSQNADDPAPAELYTEELTQGLTHVFTAVAKELGITRDRMKFNHDKKLHVSKLTPGQLVWIKRKWTKKGQSTSLATRWLGPWTIVRQMDNGVDFELRNQKGDTSIIHHDRILSTPPPKDDQSRATQDKWEFKSPIGKSAKKGVEQGDQSQVRQPTNPTEIPNTGGLVLMQDESDNEVDDISSLSSETSMQSTYEDERVPGAEKLDDTEHERNNNRQEQIVNQTEGDNQTVQDNHETTEPERRYPTRRRVPRLQSGFVNWDDVNSDSVLKCNTMYETSV